MTIMEKIKQRILKFLGLEHLSDDPTSDRYTFINNEETVIKQHVKECKIWYVGDSDELQNFYTMRDMSGNAKEPIYNRNKYNYYWGIAVNKDENPIKKVHSGVPRAIVDTLCNIIGMPQITLADDKENKIDNLIKENDFVRKLTQEARPLTCVEGWGAWKINFDKNLSKYPIFQYYEAEDVDYVVKYGKVIGIIYRDYYKVKNRNYVLLETRRIKDNNSYIEYELFRYHKDEATKVPLSTIEQLAGLPEDGLCIEGLNKVLGVPCKYFYDVFNKDYGRSIFTGKLDIFDDIDQCLSQASQTDKVSTPVEYYPTDLIGRDGNGNIKRPNVYNRQYVDMPSYPDGDGQSNERILTTQPNLNYSQYIERYHSLIDVALTGILAPASMGFDVSKKDNAEAQREKEKVTIFTRDNIIDAETLQLKELFSLGLMVQEYMETEQISIKDYDISVKYSEFANPSFESLSQILLPMFNSGAISTEKYVEKLYGDSLSDEEKKDEIAKLEANKQKDSFNLGDFGLNDENGIGTGGGEETSGEEATLGTKE